MQDKVTELAKLPVTNHTYPVLGLFSSSENYQDFQIINSLIKGILLCIK
jgi:hypothetical protein